MLQNKTNRRKWLGQASLLALSSAFAQQGLLSCTLTPNTNNEVVKLSGNENPYGPSKMALNQISNNLSLANRYPFETAQKLQSKIAKRNNVDQNQVILGSGSSQLLQLLAHWILYQKLPLVYFEPTFDIMPQMVKQLGGEVNSINTMPNFQHKLNLLEEETNSKPGVIYLVNPNNPTGISIPTDLLRNFCQMVSKHSYIIIDEAYIEYIENGNSLIDMVSNNENIIVLRTFSKIYGLAGLRVGYLIAHTNTTKKLNQLRIWNNDSLSITGVVAAMDSLDDKLFVENSLQKNNTVKKETVAALKKMGINPFPSDTNFIFFQAPKNHDLKNMLAQRNILISQKSINNNNYARVTIGTQKQMNLFIKHLTEIYPT